MKRLNSSWVAVALAAADVAPNTFLQGTGNMTSARISVPAGQSGRLLSLGFGHINGICAAGGNPFCAGGPRHRPGPAGEC
jgi:hypothetical protein